MRNPSQTSRATRPVVTMIPHVSLLLVSQTPFGTFLSLPLRETLIQLVPVIWRATAYPVGALVDSTIV